MTTVLATRSAPELCQSQSTSSPPGLTRWSMLTCGCESLSADPIELLVRMDCRIKSGMTKGRRRRNAGRRISNDPHQRMRRALKASRSPVGVPPRRLLQRTNAAAQLQLRASWDLVGAHDPDSSKDRALLSGRYPLLPVPVQRVSSQTGHGAGRAYIPEPPGSGSDEPPPAGTALAPPAGVTDWRPLRERDSVGSVAETGTIVK